MQGPVEQRVPGPASLNMLLLRVNHARFFTHHGPCNVCPNYIDDVCVFKASGIT